MLIALVACAVRVAFAIATPAPRPAWDGVIYSRAAGQLARGEGYTQRILREDASPYASAFYPPGHPFVLSLGRRAFEHGELDLALQTLAGIVASVATYFFARRFSSARVAVIAGVIVSLSPSLVLLSRTWLSEPWFIALLASGWAVLARARRPSSYVVAGLLLGASSLVRPLALLIVAFGVVLLTLRASRRRSVRRAFVSIPAFVLGAALVVVPWTLRNAHALDGPAVVSTNGGANMLLGTIGDGLFPASGAIAASIDCPHGMREVARDRCRERRARSRVVAEPLAFARLGVVKAAHTFGYETSAAMAWSAGSRTAAPLALAFAALATLCWWTAVAFAAFGARENRALTAWCAPPFFATALLHVASIGGDRYHLALWPFVAALAAVSIPNAYRYARRLRTRAPHALREPRPSADER